MGKITQEDIYKAKTSRWRINLQIRAAVIPPSQGASSYSQWSAQSL